MIDISKFTKNKGLTELEKTVFQYIVENINELSGTGVREIAKENYTSTSTIMRVAKKLGYSGFLEMQYHLRSLVDNHATSDIERSDFIESLNIESLLMYNNSMNISDFTKLLHQNRNSVIFIHANGFSSIIAEYMSKKFLVMGIRCIFSNGTDSIAVFENNIDNIGLALFISKSGETTMVINRARIASSKKIKVVSFTGDKSSSLNELSDITFKIQDNGKLDDRNEYPNTFFPKLLILVELIIFEYYRLQASVGS